MNEQEIIAKALDIAVRLTEAKSTWMRIDAQNNCFIDEELYKTFVNVLRFIRSSAAGNTRTDDITFIYANREERRRQIKF